jgi:hypothetical protein
MTTPLASEPMPGDGQVPYMSILADRLYQRLPEIYRTLDARDSTWTFKRYLGAILEQAGAGDTWVTGVDGDRPLGPASPVPWGLTSTSLAAWTAARLSRLSSLGDPFQADPAWLPWLAQTVGARLDPAASLAEQRDTIAFATSGWRAGITSAIEDAARSALTGSQYARALLATNGASAGTPWDITIVTRASETPDPSAVLNAVLRKGVKPAGAVLHTRTFSSSWDTLAAVRPTWADWEAAGSWTALEESGLSYAAVPSNLMVNPSFESGTTGWTGLHSATLASVAGGVDGTHMGTITATTGASGITAAAVIGGILTGRNYLFGFSINPATLLASVTMNVAWTTSGGSPISTTTITVTGIAAGTWQRISGQHLAPAGAANALISVDLGSVSSGQVTDIDAGLFRLV